MLGRVQVREEVALLEAALARLGVRLREEPLGEEARLAGGLCRLRGELVCLVDPSRPPRERRTVLLDALGRLDTSDVWLPPALRDALDESRREKKFPE